VFVSGREAGPGGADTGLSGVALFTFASITALFLFEKPENMSEKSPPRLSPKSLLSSFGGVAVLA
jgi:hypothetical protein